MKQLILFVTLFAASGCQSNFGNAQPSLPASQSQASVKKTSTWEPPPVIASNASDRTVFYTVSSACIPVPYTPSSGTLHTGSVVPLSFEPNGNPCSYQSVSIKATDNSGAPGDECDLVVDGYNIFVVNHTNTNCGLSYVGDGAWSFPYKLISGARSR